MAKQTADKGRDRMARITATDEVWGEFREAARVRGISVTTYLAQLVSKEVTHLRADAAKANSLTARHAAAALADARSVRDDLEAITRRLEMLTRAEAPAAEAKTDPVLPRANGVPAEADWSAYRSDGGDPADIPAWEE